MEAREVHSREAELEETLLDANRQLLERDQRFIEIIAARNQEPRRALREIERRDRDIEALNQAIALMQSTRAWRMAARYWALRDWLKRRVPTREHRLRNSSG